MVIIDDIGAHRSNYRKLLKLNLEKHEYFKSVNPDTILTIAEEICEMFGVNPGDLDMMPNIVDRIIKILEKEDTQEAD
jgi:hypothetical protein